MPGSARIALWKSDWGLACRVRGIWRTRLQPSRLQRCARECTEWTSENTVLRYVFYGNTYLVKVAPRLPSWISLAPILPWNEAPNTYGTSIRIVKKIMFSVNKYLAFLVSVSLAPILPWNEAPKNGPQKAMKERIKKSLSRLRDYLGCTNISLFCSFSDVGHQHCQHLVAAEYIPFHFSVNPNPFVQVLDISTWEWVEIEPTGELPEPRSGHQVRGYYRS